MINNDSIRILLFGLIGLCICLWNAGIALYSFNPPKYGEPGWNDPKADIAAMSKIVLWIFAFVASCAAIYMAVA